MSHRALLFVVSLGAAVTLAGCGGSASSLCSDVCDCTGCSEKEQEECVDSVEDQQKAAEDEGCGDQYDAVLSCYSDQLECRDSDIDLDGCDSEEEELSKCGGAGFGGGGIGTNACDRAADICAAAADGESGGEGQTECSGTSACAAACIVDANSCDFTDEDLARCVTDCA